MNVIEFMRLARLRATKADKHDRVLLLDAAVPVVVPGEYVLQSSPDPCDHPGTWPPFRATLFYCNWPGSVWSSAALMYTVDENDIEFLKSYLKRNLLSKEPEKLTGNGDAPEPCDALAAASRIVVVRNFAAVPGELLLCSTSYWLADENRAWGPLRLTAGAAGDVRVPDMCSSSALAAMDLLACKNVGLSDQTEPVSRQRSRHGVKGITYKTIVVTSSAKVSTKGSEKAVPIESLPRLHECRAHFKTYAPDRPLFGRVSGRYFWHQHLRGTAKDGVVVHEKYEVKP